MIAKYRAKLNEMFLAARKEYKDAWKELNDATKAEAAAMTEQKRTHSPEAMAAWGKAQTRLAKAQIAWNDAQGAFERFGADLVKLDAEVRAAIDADGLVDPAQVDAAGVTLLNSGILTIADIEKLAETYEGNRTMLRLIAKTADEMAAKIPHNDPNRGEKVAHLHNATATGQSLVEWENLYRSAMAASSEDTRMRYAGIHSGRVTPDFVCNMADKWEDFTGIKNEDDEE